MPKDQKPASPAGRFDFTSAIKELEEINRWFQSEEINLDKGLVKFRRGLALIKKCRERLRQVENEFTEIKKEFATEEKEPKVKTQDSPGSVPGPG